MAKGNWFESIEDRVPATSLDFELPAFKNGKDLMDTFFRKPITKFDDFMTNFDDFGFQDKGDHYEMTTDLGGQKWNSGTPEDAVKVELTGKGHRTVEITYEHSTSDNENCFYSHSQKTSVTLPADADEETVKAYFDENDNVVVSVDKKKMKEQEKRTPRTIPVKHKDS